MQEINIKRDFWQVVDVLKSCQNQQHAIQNEVQIHTDVIQNIQTKNKLPSKKIIVKKTYQVERRNVHIIEGRGWAKKPGIWKNCNGFRGRIGRLAVLLQFAHEYYKLWKGLPFRTIHFPSIFILLTLINKIWWNDIVLLTELW